ncbi:MAG: hypothetical protein ACQKBY_10630 [Verrucomicrobiales bacterium]
MSDSIRPWLDADELRRLAESLLDPPQLRSPESLDVPYGQQFEGFAEVAPPAPLSPDEQDRRDEAGRKLRELHELASQAGVLKPRNVPPREKQATRPRVPSVGEAPPTPFQPLSPLRSELPRSPFQVVQSPAEKPAESPPALQPVPLFFSDPDMPLPEKVAAFGKWLGNLVSASGYFLCDYRGETLVDHVKNEKLLRVAHSLAHAAAQRDAWEDASEPLRIQIGPRAYLEVLPVNTRYGMVTLGIVLDQVIDPRSAQEIKRALAAVLAAA